MVQEFDDNIARRDKQKPTQVKERVGFSVQMGEIRGYSFVGSNSD
jgi:hypothetical protein